jgi:hypothetical protein
MTTGPVQHSLGSERPVNDPHTQIAVGLEQLVILTRVTLRLHETKRAAMFEA